jgi:hypothetical protein
MKVKHFAITVTSNTGAKTTFPACNSKLRGRQWLALKLPEVTCKRCLKGVYPESLSVSQRVSIGLPS